MKTLLLVSLFVLSGCAGMELTSVSVGVSNYTPHYRPHVHYAGCGHHHYTPPRVIHHYTPPRVIYVNPSRHRYTPPRHHDNRNDRRNDRRHDNRRDDNDDRRNDRRRDRDRDGRRHKK